MAQTFADISIVNLVFRLQRFDSVAAAEIDNRNRPKRLGYIESVRSDAQPGLRVMTRTDVMVNALHFEAILVHQSTDLVEILNPYSETGLLAAAGQPVDKTRASTRIHAN